ncbi:MAG: PHP domain-containing protein, partial [Muribaculaceae bacterium]|nr:PHP domain-containing protein [Muribaculaceae bacterium]
MIPFIHLHVHSQFSILDGQAPIKSLVDKAVDNGMRGMALTDHGNMFGIKEFFDYAEKVNSDKNKKIKDLKKQLKELGDDADAAARESLENEVAQVEASRFKPIFGCEVYCARRSRHLREGKFDSSGWHLILLAKNEVGYHNLVKLVS